MVSGPEAEESWPWVCLCNQAIYDNDKNTSPRLCLEWLERDQNPKPKSRVAMLLEV